MARARNLFAAFFSFALLLGCTDSPTSSGPIQMPRDLTAAEQQVADAGGEFGLKLFQAVSEAEGDKNVFLGPLSVSMALGMTLNGAEGTTYEAMQQTLELAGLTEEEINASYQSLIELLTTVDPRVIFEIANSIWYREGFPIAPDFAERNQEYFDAVVQGLDFNAPSAVETINGWVDEKTHGKISEIVEEIDPLTMLYLINAIYFKGTWTYQFDPDDTCERPFTRTDGTIVHVPTMKLEREIPVYQDERVVAVDLPYGGELFSMSLLMPATGGHIDSLIARLDTARWSEITAGFTETDPGFLTLPKFTAEYEISLKDVLTDMGMGIAFAEGLADFDRMWEQGATAPAEELYISEVKHKTFVQVDEEGTEAAAVTSVEVGVTSMPPSIQFNRPFIYVIRERTSETILFIGKMMDPTAG
ncbi:MAG: serpin family protein [bacterium]